MLALIGVGSKERFLEMTMWILGGIALILSFVIGAVFVADHKE
ncbi:MAG: hypothetical protein ACYCOU_09275 [Sulfobacillus sp.]